MTIGRRHLLLIAQILISIALITWLVSFTHPSDLIEAARGISPLALAVTVLLLALANSLTAMRQCIILRALGIAVSLPSIIGLNWMGLFANNFLPSTVGGDAAIAAVLQRRHRRLGTIVSALLINRIFGLIGLMITLLALFIFVDLGPLQELVNRLVVWSVGLLAMAVIGVLALAFLLRGGTRLSRLLMAGLETLRKMGATALNLGWVSGAILLLSIGIMLLTGAAVAMLACWQYASAEFWTTMTIFLMLLLVQLVPVSFNGIGVAESITAYCLTQVGWPLHEAVLFGLILRAVLIVLSLPGVLGLFMIPKKNRRPETIEAEEQTAGQ